MAAVNVSVLIVGALEVEVLPILARLRAQWPLGPRLYRGRLDGADVAVLWTGVGLERAGRRTREALLRLDAPCVLSVGMAGALTDGFTQGEVLTADRIGPQWATAAPLPGLRSASILSVDAPVWSTAERARLAALGAQVCEMEAAAVQQAAGARRFSALKVISDFAGAEGGPPRLFKLRALRLSEQRLLPALRAQLPALRAQLPGLRA